MTTYRKNGKKLGVLGGLGPAASAEFLRQLAAKCPASVDQEHPVVYMIADCEIPDRGTAICGLGPSPLPKLKEDLLKLCDMGADVLAVPCNTAHYFLPRLQALTAVPFLSMLEATASACRVRFPGRTAAVLATKGTLAAGLYQKALSSQQVPFLIPAPSEQDALMRVIYDGVKAGRAPDSYRADMESVLRALSVQGADYFILGCTELPLAAELLGLRVPTVDPTAELAKTAIRFCGYSVNE